MTDIDREIDEELRQDRAAELWRKYSGLVFALAALIVIGVGAYRFYDYQRLKAAEAAGARYQNAMSLSREGKSAEAETALAAIAKDAPAGYAGLARLRAAAELGVADRDGAVKAYDALAAESGVDPLFRDIARIRAALLRVDVADRKEIETRLSGLAAAGQPFRATARELLGLVALKADDLESAGRWFDQIVTDTQASPAVKQRAQAYLAIVRSGRKS